MREVAIIGACHLPPVSHETRRDDAQLVQAAVSGALAQSGLTQSSIDFVCSGSCDYIQGKPFAFVMALDGVGAWPPMAESHVEMDGAWALYEAWVHLQTGHADTALVYCFGRPSLTDVATVLGLQLDPYTLQPLGLDDTAIAALQADCLLSSGRVDEEALATLVATRRGIPVSAYADAPLVASPLRASACPTPMDSAAAVVLAAGDTLPANAARIRGIAHCSDPHAFGFRDLADAPSARRAGEAAGIFGAPIDHAALHAPYAHQEFILREALGLGDDTAVNLDGGALVADTPMVSGLARLIAAANAIREGKAGRALGHATGGPALQQNLVCLFERSP